MGSAANFGPADYQVGANGIPGGSNPFQPGNGGGYDQRTFDLQPGDGQGWGQQIQYGGGGNGFGGGMWGGGYGTGQGGGWYGGGGGYGGSYPTPGWGGPGYGGGIGGEWGPPTQGVMPQPGPTPPSAPSKTPFADLKKGTLGNIQGHIQGGSMGKAKQAFEAGGGTWNKDIHQRLKTKYG